IAPWLRHGGFACPGRKRFSDTTRSEGQADYKRRPLARFAGYSHVAAHHLTKATRDRQAKAGAAVLARGRRLGLREFLEQAGSLFRRHANSSVDHRDLKKLLSLMHRHCDSQLDVT